MSEERRRPRSKQTYQHHKNAISITLYDPTGATVPSEVREEIQNAVWAVASQHRLLINIATS